jgi:hypothetical protein
VKNVLLTIPSHAEGIVSEGSKREMAMSNRRRQTFLKR